jgi:drug/metabolite transporter (DMT)-like permease
VTATTIALVVCASALHALWNLCAKRGDDKLVFLWASAVAGSVLLVVPVALIGTPPAWTPGLALRVIAAAILRASYFVALTAAYSRGDLSLVFPLARGIAPMLVPVLAMALLREAPSVGAAVGITAIAIGVYVTHLERLALRQILAPFRSLGAPYARYALLSGLLTAAYSVLDKSNLATAIDPLWYAYLTIPLAGLLLTPLIVRRSSRLEREFRANRMAIVGVGVMMPAAYLLVLYALRIAPVSYVAPARELSIVFVTTLGVLVLGERDAARRLAGSVLIVGGVVLLALSP